MFIHSNKGKSRFSNFYALSAFGVALGKYFYKHRERGMTDFYHVGVTTNQVSNKHGFVEMKGINSNRDSAAVGASAGDDASGCGLPVTT